MTSTSLDATENHSRWVHQQENADGGEAGAVINRWRCSGTPESSSLCSRGLPSPGKAGATGRSSRSQWHWGAPPGLQPFSKLYFKPMSLPHGQQLVQYDFALSFAGYLWRVMAGKSSSPRCPHQQLGCCCWVVSPTGTLWGGCYKGNQELAWSFLC